MFASSPFNSVLFEFSSMTMYYMWRYGHKEKKRRKKSKVTFSTAISIGRWR